MYDLVAEFVTDGNAKLYKYKSRNSGMSICICQVNGPIVGGYLTFGKVPIFCLLIYYFGS